MLKSLAKVLLQSAEAGIYYPKAKYSVHAQTLAEERCKGGMQQEVGFRLI